MKPLSTNPMMRNTRRNTETSTTLYTGSSSTTAAIPDLKVCRSRSQLAQYFEQYDHRYFHRRTPPPLQASPPTQPQSSSGLLLRSNPFPLSANEHAAGSSSRGIKCCGCCHFVMPRLSLIVLWVVCYGILSVYIVSDFRRINHILNYHLDYIVLKLHTTANTEPVNDPGMRHDSPITTSKNEYVAAATTTSIISVSDTLDTSKTTNEIIATIRTAPSAALRRKEQQQQQSYKNLVVIVAYVVVVTSCGSDDHYVPFQIAEGAAVLKHSIHQNSIRNSIQNHNNITSKSRYDYQLYAFYHPAARACAPVLQELGYTVQERNTPVDVKGIRGDFLRERIEKNGCCGERELIKLEAFTLTQHSIVVMVDLDVLVLKPLDGLFDFILDSRKRPRDDDLLFPEKPIPERIDLLYTTDYAMVSPGRKYKPTQGGFVILRPNMTIYKDFVDIVTEGNFHEDGGWGGFLGKFWGAMTFQGLMPYYFQALHPGRAVELNWCVWNNMCSPSRDKGEVDDKPAGECHTQQKDCEDCRNRPVEEVALTHFTVCQKPWLCQRWGKDGIQDRLCRKLHHEWFRVRSEMEQSWGRSGWGTGNFDRAQFFGYCTRFGAKGYQKIASPYGGRIKDIG